MGLRTSQGPLTGVRIIEVASIGPGPFACMMLADMGADVLRLERSTGPIVTGRWDTLNRGRPSVGIDIKHPEGRALIERLAASADALVEGFRPGVMERLGLGPEELLAANPALVYARMTGYGQEGPLSNVAGHDINYISIAGVLGAIRRHGERPLAPLSLIGDFGGGGMLVAFGVVCALLEARSSGRGQVIDAAMVDGAALLATATYAMRAAGMLSGGPGTNWIDGGSHWYDTYETADGDYVAVGALEPQFYARLLGLMGAAPEDFPQWDRERWPELKRRLAAVFLTRTRAEWAAILESEDACATPVLSLDEAPAHPHNLARGTFIEVEGVVQPAPAPRFSRTPGAVRNAPSHPGADTRSALLEWGLDVAEIDSLQAAGAIGSGDDAEPGGLLETALGARAG
jgi:alpha-methylacyl-CoA racemase